MMLLTKGFAAQTAPHYQAQSSAGTPLFNVEADGGVQFLGLVNNPIGSGSLEIEYRSSASVLTSYNRGGSSYQPMTLRASAINLAPSGTNKFIVGTNTSTFSNRLLQQQGADVASLNGAIALGNDGNVFEITGTNSITLITSTNWQNGAEVTFLFTSTAVLTDGTANSGADIGMELNANTNFTGSAGASITLVLAEIGGTQRWREKCRSVN